MAAGKGARQRLGEVESGSFDFLVTAAAWLGGAVGEVAAAARRGAPRRIEARQAERLVALVADRLSQSVVEQHALRRLRSYLAHFAKKRIASEWEAERTGAPASKPRRQFEAIIQSHVDGFLFSDGLFPITHADATGGSIDTFVPRSEHLFREAIETHQRPVLIELKAIAWDGKDLKGVLKNAVTRALDQAETYATHLRASVAWRAHEVAVLVVYDGPTR